MNINIIKKVGIKALVLILTITILCSSFLSCGLFRRVASSKGEIEDYISKSESRGDIKLYVSSYLQSWRLPLFDTSKFIYFEQYFEIYYNYSDGLPKKLTHAAKTARLFLDHYYDSINRDDETAVTDALLTCYVAALDDPYAIYRPPTEAENFNTDMSGSFGGIGVMVEQNSVDKTILITTVMPDSPAEGAGVMAGDFIYAIDGKTLDELGFSNSINYVRGEADTPITLTLIRNGEYVTCTMLRKIIVETNAYYEFDSESKIGYVHIVQFKGNTFEQFKKCIDELESLGAKGIIFDLRDNPGGYVTSVVDVISYLIPTGKTILTYQYKNQPTITMKSTDDEDGDHQVNLPFVVICNERTASAGEIFTAAIRDYRQDKMLRATIVGTTTYKKGVMQSPFYYDEDGSSMTFTIAYYNPPCGVNYHGIGVTPDVIVENTNNEDLQLSTAYLELQKLIDDK